MRIGSAINIPAILSPELSTAALSASEISAAVTDVSYADAQATVTSASAEILYHS
jgi:hypothetical protein